MFVECFRGRDSGVKTARGDMVFALVFAMLLRLGLGMLGVVAVQ